MLFGGKEEIYRVLLFSLIFLIVLSALEFSIENKAIHFYMEKIPSFYGILGFLSAFLIILITSLLKKIGLRKKEDYYD